MKKSHIAILALVSLISINVAHAERDDDSREVRKMVQAGKVMPLEQLLNKNRDRLQGRVLDLEMERERNRVVYEVKTLDAKGVVHKARIDAQTGEWIDMPAREKRKYKEEHREHEHERNEYRNQSQQQNQTKEMKSR